MSEMRLVFFEEHIWFVHPEKKSSQLAACVVELRLFLMGCILNMYPSKKADNA